MSLIRKAVGGRLNELLLWGALGIVWSIAQIAAGKDPQTLARGTDVGNYIPTTTTWVVTCPDAEREGRNTCLAGVNRGKKAISVYCRGESPAVWSLLKTFDDGLKEHPDVAAYVVIHRPLFDEQGYNRSQVRFDAAQRVARQQKFERVVVSLSRNSQETGLIPADEPLRIVYSDRRVVKLSQSFAKVEIEPEQVRQVLQEILKIAAPK